MTNYTLPDLQQRVYSRLDEETDVIEVVLSLDTNIYASGDVLAAMQEVTNVMRKEGGQATLRSIQMVDKDDQAKELDLVFMNSSGSIGTENAAVSISDDDADKIAGVVSIVAANYVDLLTSQIVTVPEGDANILMESASGSKSIYVGAISRGTPTHTASGITLKLGFIKH